MAVTKRGGIKSPILKSGARGQDVLSGTITLGSSGAISSVTGYLPITTTAATFGVIKTASKTGRYSLNFGRKYKTLKVVGLSIVGPTDATFGNTNANATGVRNQATDSVDLQLFLASSGADTDGASGYVINWAIEVREY
jgi:hypothetical protein